MTDPSEPIDAEIVPADPAVPPPPAPVPDYDEHGVPSLSYVRDKIEGRLAGAMGTEELASESERGRSLTDQEAERAKAAAAKLEEIRRSLGT